MRKFVLSYLIVIFLLTSCSGIDRWAKNVKSDMARGLNRYIEVTDFNGNKVWEFEGYSYISGDSTLGNISILVYEGKETKKIDLIGFYNLKSIEL